MDRSILGALLDVEAPAVVEFHGEAVARCTQLLRALLPLVTGFVRLGRMAALAAAWAVPEVACAGNTPMSNPRQLEPSGKAISCVLGPSKPMTNSFHTVATTTGDEEAAVNKETTYPMSSVRLGTRDHNGRRGTDQLRQWKRSEP